MNVVDPSCALSFLHLKHRLDLLTQCLKVEDIENTCKAIDEAKVTISEFTDALTEAKRSLKKMVGEISKSESDATKRVQEARNRKFQADRHLVG